jgi:hypothetical protein
LKKPSQKSLPSSLFQREEDGRARSPIGPLFIGAFGERALVRLKACLTREVKVLSRYTLSGL